MIARLHAGDRFILRETGRRAVVGGGLVLDPNPPERGSALRDAVPGLEAAAANGADEIADALLEVRGIASITDLERDSGGGRPSSPYRTGTLIMAERRAIALHDEMVATVTRFHSENRLRPGIPRATLNSSLGIDPDAVGALIAGSETITDDGATVRLTEFSAGLTPSEQKAWDAARDTLQIGLAVPRASQLGLSVELVHALIRADDLVKIADDLVYLPHQIDGIEQRQYEKEVDRRRDPAERPHHDHVQNHRHNQANGELKAAHLSAPTEIPAAAPARE